jgi:hypothetical protein
MRITGILGIAAATIAVWMAVSADDAIADSRMFHAYLYGGNEVPVEGDPNAFGLATVLVLKPTKLCYSILVKGAADLTAAHIHPGAPGVSGPPVVPLPVRGGSPAKIAGCVDAAADTIASIIENPQDFYLNVHNADFPGGAARGQLQ